MTTRAVPMLVLAMAITACTTTQTGSRTLDPTPSRSPRTTDSSQPVTSPAADPTATPQTNAPSPAPTRPIGVLPPDSVAVVTANDLRVRAGRPGDERHADVTGTIQAGTTVLIGGNVFSYLPPSASPDGRGWYQVHVGGRDMTSYIDGGLNGWVVEGEAGLEYLAIETPPCTTAMTSLDALVTYPRPGESPFVAAWDRVVCTGSQQLELEGVFDYLCNEGGVYPYTFTPGHLAAPVSCLGLFVDDFNEDGRPLSGGLPLRLAHADALLPAQGDILAVRGHFDDHAASDCAAEPGEGVRVSLVDPQFLILFCREQFVVDEFSVIGHRDLPPRN